MKGIIIPGNIDLFHRPHIKNPDGSVSTVLSMSFNEDGKEVLIPMVGPDRILTEDEAIKQYRKTGQHLGIFDTPDNATAYAEQLHNDYEAGKYEPEMAPPPAGQLPVGSTLLGATPQDHLQLLKPAPRRGMAKILSILPPYKGR